MQVETVECEEVMEQKFKNNYLWGKCKTRKKLSLEADRNESGEEILSKGMAD